MSIPAGSIESQIRARLKDGTGAERAVAAVLSPYADALREAGNESLAAYARPFVLRDARRMERMLTRRREDAAFAGGKGSQARLILARLEFHLPDGSAVAWEDSGREHHEARVAWLRTYIGSLEEDLDRHERALKLLAEHGAARLGDVPGWEDMIGDEADGGEDEAASGGVVP